VGRWNSTSWHDEKKIWQPLKPHCGQSMGALTFVRFGYRWKDHAREYSRSWDDSIQFIWYSPLSEITNLPQRALQSVHIRHPCPRTSHGIRKNSQEKEKTLSWGTKGEETFRRATELDPSPGRTEATDVMCTEGINTELQHIQWVWQYVWIVGSRHGPRSRPPWSSGRWR